MFLESKIWIQTVSEWKISYFDVQSKSRQTDNRKQNILSDDHYWAVNLNNVGAHFLSPVSP